MDRGKSFKLLIFKIAFHLSRVQKWVYPGKTQVTNERIYYGGDARDLGKFKRAFKAKMG